MTLAANVLLFNFINLWKNISKVVPDIQGWEFANQSFFVSKREIRSEKTKDSLFHSFKRALFWKEQHERIAPDTLLKRATEQRATGAIRSWA